MTHGKIAKAKVTTNSNTEEIWWLSGELGMPEVDGILLYGWENYIVENFYKPYSVSLLDENEVESENETYYKTLGASLFPTYDETGKQNTNKFFGSVQYKDEILYILLAPKEVTSVEFLTKSIEKGGWKVENLTDEMYKLVWYVESSKALDSKINVMYIGLDDIKMPYRNMTNYLEPIDHNPITVSDKKEHNVAYDELTGTILANEEIKNTPLLNYIKSINSSKTWNPRNTYRRGETVKWKMVDKERTFVSLKDWNIGEQPGISKYWQDQEDFGFLGDKYKFDIKVYNDKGKEISEYPGHLSFRTYVNVKTLNLAITLADGYFLADIKGDGDNIDEQKIKELNILKKSVDSYIRGDRKINVTIYRKDAKNDIGQITLVFLKKARKDNNNWEKPHALICDTEEQKIINEDLTDYGKSFTVSGNLNQYGTNIKSIKKSIKAEYLTDDYTYNYALDYTNWKIEETTLKVTDTYLIPFSYIYTVEFSSKLSASFVGYKGFFVDHINKEIVEGAAEFKLMPIEEGTTLKIQVDGSSGLSLSPGNTITTSSGSLISLSKIDSSGIYTLTITKATSNHTFKVI